MQTHLAQHALHVLRVRVREHREEEVHQRAARRLRAGTHGRVRVARATATASHNLQEARLEEQSHEHHSA